MHKTNSKKKKKGKEVRTLFETDITTILANQSNCDFYAKYCNLICNLNTLQSINIWEKK